MAMADLSKASLCLGPAELCRGARRGGSQYRTKKKKIFNRNALRSVRWPILVGKGNLKHHQKEQREEMIACRASARPRGSVTPEDGVDAAKQGSALRGGKGRGARAKPWYG